MKNTMHAEEINERVKELREALDRAVECLKPDIVKTGNATDLEKVHGLCTLKAVNGLVENLLAWEYTLEASEEEFRNAVTDDGKKDIKLVLSELMLQMAMEVFEDRTKG